MEVEKRIFVGGLFKTVQESELKEKFGRYGDVQNIEIKCKQGSDGNTEKTFAYVNLKTTPVKLQTCFNAFNKCKWKGSILTLQHAKEDFIKRLQQEREKGFSDPKQVHKEKKSSFQNPLENVEGVREFHMKGAVPGTPVTESKEWVVGKFGRVLPVVKLRGKHKNKMVKVDPSKYCHNLKKVDQNDTSLPLQQNEGITWEIDDEDSEIIRRRKGEFPKWQPLKKKKKTSDECKVKTLERLSSSDIDNTPSSENELEIVKSKPVNECIVKSNPVAGTIPQIDSSDSESDYESMKKNSTVFQCDTSFTDNRDIGLKRKSVEKEENNKKHTTKLNGVSVKTSKDFTGKQKPENKCVKLTKEPVLTHSSNTKHENNLKSLGSDMQKKSVSLGMGSFDNNSSGNDSDNNSVSSADTDIVISRTRKDFHSKTSVDQNFNPFNRVSEFYGGGLEDMSKFDNNDSTDNDDSFIDILDTNEDFKSLAQKIESEYSKTFDKSDSSKNSIVKHRTNFEKHREYDSDSETKELSTRNTSNSESECSQNEHKSFCKMQNSMSKNTTNFERNHNSNPSSDSEERTSTENLIQGVKKFKGTKSLFSSHVFPVVKTNKILCEDTSPNAELHIKQQTDIKEFSVSSDSLPEHMTGENIVVQEESRNHITETSTVKNGKISKKEDEVRKALRKKKKEDKKLKKESEKKRLASLEQRKKESQAKKLAIKSALSNVDETNTPNRKVVFDSDSDEDDREMNASEIEEASTLNHIKQHNDTMKKPSLFDDSSDEDSEEDDDNDEERFRLRPEFEGSAGKKLMNLQSRIGSDERFRMDERFVEEEDEEAVVTDTISQNDEKVQSLKILQEVVGKTIPLAPKGGSSSKLFKDISALHFDPLREDHGQFEVKHDNKEPETPIEKKKKKKDKKKKTEEEKNVIEEEDIPEVSKERFFQVSSSLTDVFKGKSDSSENTGFSLLSAFGSINEENEEDKDEDAMEVNDGGNANVMSNKLFTSTENQSESDESENDTDEFEDEEEKSEETVKDQTPVIFGTKQQTFFFYSEEDPRIQEGIKFFCRKDSLDEIRQKWSEERQNLVHSYLSKHKNMLRKQRQGNKQKKRDMKDIKKMLF